MTIKYILPIVLVVSAVLLVNYVQSPNALQDQNNTAESQSATFLSPPPDKSPQTDNNSYFQALLSKGVSIQEAQLLVFYRIKQKYLISSPQPPYWQVSMKGQPSVDKLSQMRQVRSALIAAFGETARDNGLFKEAFYPLATEADYLSSAEQIALVEQMAKQQAKQQSLWSQGLSPADLPLENSDPSQILSTKAAFEWKLRQSFLAQKMRDSGASFNEQSFRDSYRLLAPIYDFDATATLPSGSDIRQAANGLETLLGADDAIRVQASLDPRFSQFKSLAQQQGLSNDQVTTAFGIVWQAQTDMMQAFDLMASDEDRAMEIMNQATLTRDNSLVSFIGKEKADQLINAYETTALEKQGIPQEIIHLTR